AVGVAGEHRLIALELCPANVTLVVLLDEHLPGFNRFAVAVALARTAINDLGALLALSVGVDAGIESVLQNRDDVTIPNRPPLERRQCSAVRWIGKVNVLGCHPQQDLPGTA